ncbi:T9SS C-terminal target domain-containing protein [Flavobacterium cupreum]|uniref:Secreted protein (Por secretion system target) n=2 Tax=Flavobacterium TaxID=237 RepID=A0A4Y7UEN6_9FLAO|nr:MULTISPECIES: T9SS type A sorting domain-containing protein [Flavobacterium]RUT67970.1 T9SS C-terminal target domain-containing protein [Flavobacterium cupreum]TCN58995.1 putative secreted protein (Por secretion system target) [Flavobacterium circumlabens]TEB44398.1 T9SS C-terminal target domain-containing protein [Flavobacterium circumlabens]
MKRAIFINLILLLAVLTTSVSGARNIYVATTGNDSPNDGTIDKPYLTINKAAHVAVAGDVVIIKSGTYSPTLQIDLINSGTSLLPITYKAEISGEVIIDGSVSVTPNVSNRRGLITIAGANATNLKSWIIIDGLRIINSKWAGIIAINSSNITIKNCSTFNTGASGIIGATSSNIKVLNNKVQQACVYPDKAAGTNECITMASVETFEVGYNTVSDRPTDPSNGGEGIDAKNASSNGTIHHNTVFNLYRVGIYVDAYQKNINNVEVYANKVYDIGGGGITIASEEGGTAKGVKVHDNVIYNIKKVGIRIAGYLNNGPLQEIDVYQNTIVNCGTSAGNWENCGLLIEATNAANYGFNIRNNIIAGSPVQIRGNNQTYPIVIDNNILFGSTLLSGTNAILLDPKFVDAASNDYKLKEGSPAINKVAGAPLSIKDFNDLARSSGNQGDLGAFEYSPNLGTADLIQKEAKDFRVYPNPVKETINIDMPFVDAREYKVALYDLQGKLIYSEDASAILLSGTDSFSINSNKLSSGLYVLKIVDKNGEIFSAKIVIEK